MDLKDKEQLLLQLGGDITVVDGVLQYQPPRPAVITITSEDIQKLIDSELEGIANNDKLLITANRQITDIQAQIVAINNDTTIRNNHKTILLQYLANLNGNNFTTANRRK